MAPSRSVRSSKLGAAPEILIFDVDGVLVDVRGTYWKSALETIRHLTGKKVTHAELHRWKAKPGHNDDWRMTSAWATSLGVPTTYAQARAAFEKFYWGTPDNPGNIRNEKMVITGKQVAKWAAAYELNIFTGRTRDELKFTFDKWDGGQHFRRIVTMNDVTKGKPHPEGLLKILDGRDPSTALYLGDNVDDALAARDAGVPFIGVLAPGRQRHRSHAGEFRKLGALALLPSVLALTRWLAQNPPQSAALRSSQSSKSTSARASRRRP